MLWLRLTFAVLGPAMLRFALSLRFIMLVASFGAAMGALVLFWQGSVHMVRAIAQIFAHAEGRQVIVEVMAGTDVYLFGVVLIIFSYAIAFGFAFDLTADQRQRLPAWMRPSGMSDLKVTLVAAILVYLIVDFATDWSQQPIADSWLVLTKPIAILLIAAAFRLFVISPGNTDRSTYVRPAQDRS